MTAAKTDSLANLMHTLDAAAVLADVSRRTLERAIAKRELRAKKVGRGVRVRHGDLQAWIDALPDAS